MGVLDDELDWRGGRYRRDALARQLGRTARARSTSALTRSPPARRAPPVIVKVCRDPPRTRAAARNAAAYVARMRECDRQGRDKAPRVYDERGLPVDRDEVLQILDDWNLKAEERMAPRARIVRHAARAPEWAERLLEAARAADGEGPAGLRARRALLREAGVSACGAPAVHRLVREGAADVGAGVTEDGMSDRERWRAVVARHVILSVPVTGELEIKRFELAAREAVCRTFGMWGHRCLLAFHREHGREPHMHVLVRNRNDDGEPLRFDPDGLLVDRLREALAEAATDYGLRVEATRHADRPELVGKLLAGECLLPDSERAEAAARAQGGGRADGMVRLMATKVPSWVAHHGLAYAARRRGEDVAPVRRPPPGYDRLASLMTPVYGAATDSAMAAFDEMRREEALRRKAAGKSATTPFAEWLLHNHPLAFGPMRARARAERARLRAALRGLPSPAQPEVLHGGRLEEVLRAIGAAPGESERRLLRQRSDVGKVVRHLVDLAWSEETLNRGVAALDAAVALRDRAAEIAEAHLPDAGRRMLDRDRRRMAQRDREAGAVRAGDPQIPDSSGTRRAREKG